MPQFHITATTAAIRGLLHATWQRAVLSAAAGAANELLAISTRGVCACAIAIIFAANTLPQQQLQQQQQQQSLVWHSIADGTRHKQQRANTAGK